MAYVKILYQDSPSTATPLNAQNLNHMDDQIALNDQRLTDLEGAHVSSFNGRTGAVTPADGDYDIGQIAPLTGAQVGQVPVVTNIGTEEDPELVFRMGAGGGAGGHEIIDSEGNTMPQESAMQFPDSFISDDNVNGRTVVENIKAVTQAQYPSQTEDGTYLITDGEGAVIEPASDDYVEVTADGVKNLSVLLDELHALIDTTKISARSYLHFNDAIFNYQFSTARDLCFSLTLVDGSGVNIQGYILRTSSSGAYAYDGTTISPYGTTNIPTSGTKITLYYGNKKATVDLQTTANRCWMADNSTVQDTLCGDVETFTPTAKSGCTITTVHGAYTKKTGHLRYIYLDITINRTASQPQITLPFTTANMYMDIVAMGVEKLVDVVVAYTTMYFSFTDATNESVRIRASGTVMC